MNAKKIKIGIYGAGGLTGRELLNILKLNDHIEVIHVTSNVYEGKSVSSVFTELTAYNSPYQKTTLSFSSHSKPLPTEIDLMFLAVPNQTSLTLVPELIQKKIKCIDLSGSFRLHDQSVWEDFYLLKHTAFEQMKNIVFGLPELFRDQIKKSHVISNPGCYPTGPIIALNTINEHSAKIHNIIIDAKSGISGAGGRTEDSGFQYKDIHENFRAYKILKHQHQPEIEEYAFYQSKTKPKNPLVFTPHLLPIDRGILSTIYIHWENEAPKNLKELLEQKCHREPFLRFYQEPEEIEIKKVAHTNFVDIAIKSQANTTIIVTAIDNLLKGAAGQAVQNMNLMLGLPEETSLI